MMKTALVSLVSFISLLFATFADQTELPKEAIESLRAGTEFILYSLEPGPITLQPQPPLKPEQSLNGFKILGRLSLTEPKARSIAVAAVADAIHASDYRLRMMCFRPRHALHVTTNGKEFDFMICYECQTIKLYQHGVAVAGIGIPNLPEQLNKLLSAAKIPLAEQPSPK